VRVALDTNRYRDLIEGDTKLGATLADAETVFVPFIVLAELRAGFAAGTKQTENERLLQTFLARPGVELLFPDEATTRHYAAGYRQLRAQGQMIPMSDLWIAALVLQHGLTLCSRDAHFDHLPQIARV